MNLKMTREYIMSHPATKFAFLKYFEGDSSEINSLIDNIMFHVADKTCLHISRIYTINRNLNSCDIRDILRNSFYLENLDIKLSIPKTPQKDIDLKLNQIVQNNRQISHKKEFHIKQCQKHIINQLEFIF